jgi:ABC-2 type transport system ATP-binding protein
MIRTEELSKSYGKFQALVNLNLHISEGKVFGFIGPNGAGKSTTMLILSTLLKPTSGKAFVGNHQVDKEPQEVRQLLGYMPDFFGVYDNLKAYEYLDFYCGASRIPERKRTSHIANLLELVNLSHKADSYVDSLSRGMKQRLGLARCLVHDPKVLILDEPASGLDPRARIEMREILKQLRGLEKTILISSHILPELAGLCDEIGVIEKGKLLAFGAVEDIAALQRRNHELEVKVLSGELRAAELLTDFPTVKNLRQKDRLFKFEFTGTQEDRAMLLKELLLAEVPVISFANAEDNLENIFLSITEGGGN